MKEIPGEIKDKRRRWRSPDQFLTILELTNQLAFHLHLDRIYYAWNMEAQYTGGGGGRSNIRGSFGTGRRGDLSEEHQSIGTSLAAQVAGIIEQMKAGSNIQREPKRPVPTEGGAEDPGRYRQEGTHTHSESSMGGGAGWPAGDEGTSIKGPKRWETRAMTGVNGEWNHSRPQNGRPRGGSRFNQGHTISPLTIRWRGDRLMQTIEQQLRRRRALGVTGSDQGGGPSD